MRRIAVLLLLFAAVCAHAGPFSISGGSSTPSAAGADTQVQFNDAAAFAGNAAFIYNKTTKLLANNGPVRIGPTVALTSDGFWGGAWGNFGPAFLQVSDYLTQPFPGINTYAINGGGSFFNCFTSNGTAAVPTQTLSGDSLCAIGFLGKTQSGASYNWIQGMYFQFNATGNFTDSSAHTQWIVGDDQSNALMTVDSNGIVFGTASGGAKGIGTINAVGVYQGGVQVATLSGGAASMAYSSLSYQPGLLTTIISTKSVFSKVVPASIVDNIIGSAQSLTTCTTNPTISMYECGTDATCASPTTIGSIQITATGQAFSATVSNAAIGANHYVGWAISGGACASLDIGATAQIHTN